MKRLILIAAVVALASLVLGAIVVSAPANENAASVKVSWGVEGCWIKLVVTPREVDLGASQNGEDLKKLQANDVAIEANCNWVLSLKEDDGKIDYNGSYPDPHKPVSDFKWRINGTATYHDLSASNQQVTRGTGALKFPMDYKIDIRFTDSPGTYTAVLVYTATTP